MTYDWESRRDEILELYQRQGKPLHEVMKIMKERYDFGPSSVLPPSKHIL